jgi:hypothetical protein
MPSDNFAMPSVSFHRHQSPLVQDPNAVAANPYTEYHSRTLPPFSRTYDLCGA